MLHLPATEGVIDAKDAAEHAGLVYVSDERPGIRRKRSGKGFRYETSQGKRVSDEATLSRIKALAVPPAWTEVWICRNANGHIQATGRDARNRKQYRYHSRFREIRESTKYDHMLAFAEQLPAIRRKVQEHLAQRGLPREKVLATVVHLLETTLIRVGSDEYARTNKSYGLTTLKNRHVAVEGSALKFNFKGKSGKVWKLNVRNRRVAKVIRACQDLPGQELFQYIDEQGEPHDVTSTDVNAYLREICGEEITAKDFRTWHGTVLAAMALHEFQMFDSEAGAKRNIREAIQGIAARLGNTPTICRKCYVHPQIITTYVEGSLLLDVKEKVEAELRDDIAVLTPEEAAVLTLLRHRLSLTLKDKLESSLAAA
jgi:DNA topoisomerase-1